MTVDRLERAKDLQGYRHMFTFWDGPRICLGKGSLYFYPISAASSRLRFAGFAGSYLHLFSRHFNRVHLFVSILGSQ
jgi:hypothetical protein